jgi:8-oxo-dGTP diphosphatase
MQIFKKKIMPHRKYCYDYPRPALSSDIVLFGFDGTDLNILLIRRGKEPFKGNWAFPGGFMEMDETTEECAIRELEEETGLTSVYLEQLNTFSGIERDPRERVVTVAYLGLVRIAEHVVTAGDDAEKVSWFRLKDIPPLCFDHDFVLETAMKRLREKLGCGSGISELLGVKFTTAEFETLDRSVRNDSP